MTTRREFLAALGGAAAAWPLGARAQRSGRIRRIGFLISGGIETDPAVQADLAVIREELAKQGWIEGRNLQIDRRFGGGDPNRIRFLVDELVSLAPEMMIVTGLPGTLATQIVTRTIPIVFVSVGDPVENGLISNIARPDGNTTGFTNQFTNFTGKWLELLKEAAPHLLRVAVVYNPQTSASTIFPESIEAEAAARGVKATKVLFHDSLELVRGIDEFAAEPNGGLIIPSSGATVANRSTIIRLAAQHHLPAIYPYKFYAAEGGLMAYGPDILSLYRGAAGYVHRLLKGEPVADLPVQASTKYELVINLKTAKALGLTVPPTLFALANEIIE
jgi:putative ABC transport system substrate-binding protein